MLTHPACGRDVAHRIFVASVGQWERTLEQQLPRASAAAGGACGTFGAIKKRPILAHGLWPSPVLRADGGLPSDSFPLIEGHKPD